MNDEISLPGGMKIDLRPSMKLHPDAWTLADDRTEAAPKPPDTPDREMDATNAALLAVITGGTVADVSAALAAERRAWLRYGADYALWTMKRLRGGKP